MHTHEVDDPPNEPEHARRSAPVRQAPAHLIRYRPRSPTPERRIAHRSALPLRRQSGRPAHTPTEPTATGYAPRERTRAVTSRRIEFAPQVDPTTGVVTCLLVAVTLAPAMMSPNQATAEVITRGVRTVRPQNRYEVAQFPNGRQEPIIVERATVTPPATTAVLRFLGTFSGSILIASVS